MPLKIGTNEVSGVYIGSTPVVKIYVGTTVIYELADGTYLELIEDITVGNAVTSVQFSGFTATKEDTLMLVADINNTSGSTSNYELFVNNDLVTTNYWFQFLLATGTTIVGGRGNNARIIGMATGGKNLALIPIKLTNDGHFTFQAQNSRDYNVANGIDLDDQYCSKTATITNITQLDVVADVASAIGIGSRFQLYKVVA